MAIWVVFCSKLKKKKEIQVYQHESKQRKQLKWNQKIQNNGCEHLLPLSPFLVKTPHFSFGKLIKTIFGINS